MKKKITSCYALLWLVLFIVPASCISSQSFIPIKGSGNSVDKNFSISDFQGIDVSGGFDVVLVQGNTEELILTAQENLFDHITVKVEQGILKIYTEENIMSTKPMRARISYKSIDNLKVSGGGDVISETQVNVPALNTEISGGGDITLAVNTGELDCRISGGGDAKIDGSIKIYKINVTGGGDLVSNLASNAISCNISGGGDLRLRSNEKVTDANIDISGGGDVEAEMNAGKMKCAVSGGGNATLKGQADELEININGGGDINAGNMAVETASFQASGGSDVHVNVSKELNGRISGGGDIYYAGGAEDISIDAKGGSEIHKE